MTIALALLAAVLVLVAIVAATLHHRHRHAPADVLHHHALKRVVERHEKEQLGRD